MNQDQLNKLVKLITVCATAFIVLLVGIIAFQRIKFARLQNEVDDELSEEQKIEVFESFGEDSLEELSSEFKERFNL